MSEENKVNPTEQTENKVINFPKKDNGIEVEIVDQNYRLVEMAEAMEQSIANAKKVAKEQAHLIRVVNKSEDAKDFVEFVKGVEQQIEGMNGQVATLTIRAGLLRKVVDKCNENEEISKVVSMTLKALGVFEKN